MFMKSLAVSCVALSAALACGGENRVEFKSCPKCDKRIRIDLVEMADVGRFEESVCVKVAPHSAKFFLAEGMHSIRLSNDRGWMPDIDRLVLK